MPFADDEGTQLLRQLIATFEHLLHENIALKDILRGINVPGFQELWPQALAEMLAHPEANRELHRTFLSLYERADRVLDETTAFATLRSIPDLEGKVD